MTQNSKATNDSGLNWFRINLSKRKELEAFRKIITEKINGFNANRTGDCIVDGKEIFSDHHDRSYLFPSNINNVNGYFDSIMSNIKFSCWVKCTEEELLDILNVLNEKDIISDVARKSNSGSIRVANENEINTLRWIIEYAPQNLFRANVVPSDTKPATIIVPGDVIVEGELSKMRGKVETDKFYFSVLGTTLFMVISKGIANEAIDFSQELENARKNKALDEANNIRQWMVLRASHGAEQNLEEKLSRWKEYKENHPETKEEPEIVFETYLPMFLKDVKRGNKIIGQRKALFCPGYLFIYTSISELLRIEIDRYWDGFAISRLLVRQSMRKGKSESKALTISDRQMADFKFIVDSNLTNIALEAEDYIDKEYVRFFDKDSAFNQKIGQVLHKGNDLYITFFNLEGIMRYTKAIKIESSQIRKLTEREIAELKLNKQ